AVLAHRAHEVQLTRDLDLSPRGNGEEERENHRSSEADRPRGRRAHQSETFPLGGSVSVKRLPDGLDTTEIVPPCCSTTLLAIASPSPVPSFLPKDTKGSKISSIRSGGIPDPSSATEIVREPSDFAERMAMLPLPGMAAAA